MGKKDNAKAQQKKAERKAMEEKMNRMVANVKLANSVEDPLALLPKPFTVYNKNGLELTLETVRAPELPESDKVSYGGGAGVGDDDGGDVHGDGVDICNDDMDDGSDKFSSAVGLQPGG